MIAEGYRALSEAKEASRCFALIPAAQRTAALLAMANAMESHAAQILSANEADLAAAEAACLEKKRIGILRIGEKDIAAMAAFFRDMAQQPDPVGRVLEDVTDERGLRRVKKLHPLGVVAMVSEARPSVLTDCAALCMRTGNALAFLGSRHSVKTDAAVTEALREALVSAELPAELITNFPGDHELSYELAQQDRLVDLVIVRGGYDALREIKRAATVPVIGAGPGNCHIYIDAAAEPEMALRIVRNSKVPRPLACNAAETLLVQRDWAAAHLDALLGALTADGIALRGSDEVCTLFHAVEPAGEKDWEEEYFAPTLAVKLVADVKEAIDHINRYRTPHTECIVTEDEAAAERFLQLVEANVVCHNTATRLTDGTVFGLGGEMGISTQKYPVGGPIGPLHLMQQKYFLSGNGVLR